MKTIDRLRGDHGELREALEALANALERSRHGAELQEVEVICRQLSNRLWQHIRREELVATLCNRTTQRLGAVDLDRLALEHYEELEYLRAVTPAFSQKASGPSLAALHLKLERIAELLERHMAVQEARLFPMMEGVLLPRKILRGGPGQALTFLFHRPE